MDVEHCAGQLRELRWPPAAATVYEHRAGPATGEGEGADDREDDTARWQAA